MDKLKKIIFLMGIICLFTMCDREVTKSFNNRQFYPSIWIGNGITIEFQPSFNMVLTRNKKTILYRYHFVDDNLIKCENITDMGGKIYFEVYIEDIYMKFGSESFGYYNLIKQI